MAVSVIISNFNGAKYLPRLLQSLQAQQEVTPKIIVVDRNSTDESPAILAQHPDVTVVTEPPESGLVAGYHAGTRIAQCEHLFFCNEDMWLGPDCLARLEREIDLTRRVACADPWQWTYDGSRLIHSGVQIRRHWNRGSPYPRYEFSQNEFTTCGHLVACACAGAMMIHRLAYHDVGGWDTTFFLDHEDTDLSIRLWQHGWLTVTVPEAKVFHAVGASNHKVIPKGNVPVGKKRYVSASSNQFVVAWKLFSPNLWLMPFVPWLETVLKDLFKLRLRRAAWDILAFMTTLARLPHVFRFRRSNRMARRRRPAESFFLDKTLQFGSSVKPETGFPNRVDRRPVIRISVALVTRNRPASLERTLRSWRRQSVEPLEVVISDDSDPAEASSVQKLAAGYDCRYHRGPRKGLYANRNHVVQFCSGTHVLTGDDDHEHPADYLEKIERAAREEPRTIWCMGELYSWQDLENRLPWQGPGQISSHGSLWPAPKDSALPCWAISDGATLYPREVFDFGFRFYDAIKFGDSYKEFGCLLFKAGWRIRVLDHTGVIHHLEEVGRSFNNREEEQVSNYFAMFMFSFYYQPSFRNVIVTASKAILLVLGQPLQGLRILSLACKHYGQRRSEVHPWRSGAGPKPEPADV